MWNDHHSHTKGVSMTGSKLWKSILFCALLGSAACYATPITKSIEITASDFYLAQGNASAPPVSQLILDFTVSFDNAADIGPTTNGLTVHSFNFPGPVAYDYVEAGDMLILASFPVAHGGCFLFPDNFCLAINPFSSEHLFVFGVDQTTWTGDWIAQTVSINVENVPEPGTLALFGLGLACGAAVRRHKKVQDNVLA
jgi:hypothetical protein